ncbi:hypothetical protein ACJW30_05G070700 [Castanea mollissima]
MVDLQANYNTCSTCMKSYLQGLDLWEVVVGGETTTPKNAEALQKWKIKALKAFFAIKTSSEEEMLEHIRCVDTLRAAWTPFLYYFSKKNDVKLQLLENELMSEAQQDMAITQYFNKVKSLCREISESDPASNIFDLRTRRIIIHGLRLEYRLDLENLLADQEALVKQMTGVALNSEEEALFSIQYKDQPKRRFNVGSKNKNNENREDKKCSKD